MINDGGPAFARPSGEARDAMGNQFWPPAQEGLSVRDYFAAAALQGLLAQADPPANDRVCAADFAAMAYEYADAMITEREAKQ